MNFLVTCGVTEVFESDCNLLVMYFDSDPVSHEKGAQLDY